MNEKEKAEVNNGDVSDAVASSSKCPVPIDINKASTSEYQKQKKPESKKNKPLISPSDSKSSDFDLHDDSLDDISDEPLMSLKKK
ncbi:hypothetical protein FQR65_LT11553 [Abscondita terminalis]|nr:hypothetical protein FQR65_LT11553 [Abscondita terminalis]